MSLNDMFALVRSHNAEGCLQRIICELSVNSRAYGKEGEDFGIKLLRNYGDVSHAEADQYKYARTIGTEYKSRAICRRSFKSCGRIRPADLIGVGNTIV